MTDQQKEEAVLTAFGKAVRKLRIDAGMKLKEMAERLNKTPAFLSAVETGRKPVPEYLAASIADMFELDAVKRQELMNAAAASANEVSINMKGLRYSQREVAAAFARQFSSLDEDELAQIRKLLEMKHS